MTRARLSAAPVKSAASPKRLTPASAAPRALVGSGGQALDRHTNAAMSARFGHDFSQVRIHTDARAGDSAASVGADAYALGGDIVFGEGKFQPGSPETERLLAHELTHVVQQARWGGPGDWGRASRAGDDSEREAEVLASQVMMGRSVRVQAAPIAALARRASRAEEETARAGSAPEDSAAPGLDRNALMEQAAHVLAYEDTTPELDALGQPTGKYLWKPTYKPTDHRPEAEAERQKHAFATASMEQAGMDVEHSPSVHGVDGFAMRSFRPKTDKDGVPLTPGANPIVAFRGTANWDGVKTDLNPEGVGVKQYAANHDLIMEQAREAYGDGRAGGLSVTGHSLGGAEGQMFSAELGGSAPGAPGHIGIKDVTTFQSARVNHDVAARFDADNAARAARNDGEAPMTSVHNRVAGDIVPSAGFDMTRGTINTFDQDQGLTGVRNTEMALMLAEAGHPALAALGLGAANEYAHHTSFPATARAVQSGQAADLPGAGIYAAAPDHSSFSAPKVTDTEQDKAHDWHVAEYARQGVGYIGKGCGLAYDGVTGGMRSAYNAGAGGLSFLYNKVSQAGTGVMRATQSLFNSGDAQAVPPPAGAPVSAGGSLVEWSGSAGIGGGIYNAPRRPPGVEE